MELSLSNIDAIVFGIFYCDSEGPGVELISPGDSEDVKIAE